MIAKGETFNEVYAKVIHELFNKGAPSVSRRGVKIFELYDAVFMLTNPEQCLAHCRDISMDYLEKEFDFYMSGSDRLEDAVKCSKFWKNCSDDGVTINSNYGKRLFHDKNKHGVTQFEHALNCLESNLKSKKAVMIITSQENAYVSNDNFCTMSLRARVDDDNKLHLTSMMRSNDIFFGAPYDVPFFCFVQMALVANLSTRYPQIKLGTYTHIANSLHFYERNREELYKAVKDPGKYVSAVENNKRYSKIVDKGFKRVSALVGREYFMTKAWEASKKSKCLKKKVGCVITQTINGVEKIIATGYGDVGGTIEHCLTCARDDDNDKWYECGCWSVHGEYRAILHLLFNGFTDFYNCTMYCTHNSCDSCCRLMDYVGISKVVYDKPYKIDESHWPNTEFEQLQVDHAE